MCAVEFTFYLSTCTPGTRAPGMQLMQTAYRFDVNYLCNEYCVWMSGCNAHSDTQRTVRVKRVSSFCTKRLPGESAHQAAIHSMLILIIGKKLPMTLHTMQFSTPHSIQSAILQPVRKIACPPRRARYGDTKGVPHSLPARPLCYVPIHYNNPPQKDGPLLLEQHCVNRLDV